VAIAAIAGFSSHGHDTTTRPRCHPVGLSDRGMGDMAGLPLRHAGRVIMPGPGDRVLLLPRPDDDPPAWRGPPGSPR